MSAENTRCAKICAQVSEPIRMTISTAKNPVNQFRWCTLALAKASGQSWTGLAKVQKLQKMKTFATAFEDYLEAGRLVLKPSTVLTYRNNFNAHRAAEFGNLKINQITKERLIKFQNKLAEGRSTVRTNNVMNLMRTILKRCIEEGLIAENPCDKIKRLREESAEIDPLTVEELEKLSKDWINSIVHCLSRLLGQECARMN